MGDTLLKAYIVCFFLSVVLSAQENPVELSWVDAQVEAIKPPREGVSDKDISLLKDPFIFLKTKEEKTEEKQHVAAAPSVQHTSTKKTMHIKKRPTRTQRLKLSAILNQSALINGRWFKLGEKVAGFTITQIDLQKVILQKGSKKLVLTTYTIPQP